LKTLKFKTPFDFLIERYKIIPKVFYKNPLHYSRGLNTYRLLEKSLRPKRFNDFDLTCKLNGIRHRLTKFRHPWTNGQVERFNKTIKDATVKIYHYDNFQQLEKHLQEFIFAYNLAKRLKTLKFKHPLIF